MLHIDPLILTIIAANTILACLILLRSRKAPGNLSYGMFVLFLDLWIVANFLENEPLLAGMDRLALFLRLDFALAIFILYSWLRFSISFAGRLKDLYPTRAVLYGAFGFGVALAYASFTDLVVRNIEFDGIVIHFENGPLWPLYAGYLLVCVLGGVWTLGSYWLALRRRGDRYAQKSINLIFIGFFLSLGNALLINLFLQPFLPVTLLLSRLGIYGMSFLVIATAYAIIRQQFLNIKVITVEALMTVMTLIFAIRLLNRDYEYPPLLDGMMLILVVILASLVIRGIHIDERQHDELERLTGELGRANGELQRLSSFKSRLLSIASHQIKSPIAIIKGYASNLGEGLYGQLEPKVKETVSKIQRSAEDLALLIEDFLDLRQLEEGKVSYHFGTVDLVSVLATVADTAKEAAQAKGLDFSWYPPPHNVFVRGDVRKLHEVVQNLLDNAVKYTAKGYVRLAVRVLSAEARITVEDSGMGIDPDLAQRLFEEFERGSSVQSMAGTGIGLYVAKRIVEAHKGRIWAESEGEGKGSKFMVALPLLK